MYHAELQAGVPIGPAAPDQGLAPGALVVTLAGERPVDHLRAGDIIVTRDSGPVVLEGIRLVPASGAAIRIEPGAFGADLPEAPVDLPPDALILPRDAGDLCPAAALTDDGRGQCVAGADMVYQLVFERRHIIYVSGLQCLAGAER